MRLFAGLQLRVKDIDIQEHPIVVRDGKGQNDRVTMLPETLGARSSRRAGKRRRAAVDARELAGVPS